MKNIFKKSLALMLSFLLIHFSPAFAQEITVEDGSVNNWDTFNVNEGEHASITVVDANGNPMADGRAIINVLQNYATEIGGTLDINGIIALLNSNGFHIGANADINVVGGLILSTLGISEQDFFAGMTALHQAGSQPGFIQNEGNINIDAGSFLALIAGAIKNTGTIASEGGTAVLAAGKEGYLTIGGDGLVNVQITKAVDAEVYDLQGNKVADQISNSGNISANGGFVKLTAKGAEEVFDNVINHSGIIEAKSVSEQNGKVILEGGDEGVVRVSGTIDVSGNDAGEKGGTVQITGEKIGVFDHAKIDASGNAGGGTVLVGGDYQGKNVAMQNALAVYVSEDAMIDASAKQTGNGGKVIVWSDGSTRAYGSIEAKGGTESGNGGFVETSGHYLDVTGIRVSTNSSYGQSGQWLLDPYNLTISDDSNSNVTGASPFSPSESPSILNVSTLVTALNSGDVIVQTGGDVGSGSGNITIASHTSISYNSSHDLTLDAYGSVEIGATVDSINNPTISNLGSGSITIKAGYGAGASGTLGTITFDSDAGIYSNGSLTLNSKGSISQAGTSANDFINVNGLTVDSGGGDINLQGVNSVATLNITNAGSVDFVDSNETDFADRPNLNITGITAAWDVHITENSVYNAAGDIIVSGVINADGHSVTLTNTNSGIHDDDGAGSIIAATTNLTAGSTLDDTEASISLTNNDNELGTVNATAYGADGIVLNDGNAEGVNLNTINNHGSAAALTVTSAGNIIANSAIQSTGGNMTFNAGGDFSQSADGSIVTGSDSTWGDVTIHAGIEGAGTGAVTLAGSIEGDAVVIDTDANSTGDITQSGSLISHDTGTVSNSIVITNYGTGDIVQTGTGTMTLTYVDSRNIGASLSAAHGNIQQSGSLDAKQSRVTFSAAEGDTITQDDGGGHLGSITAGMTTLSGQSGATVNLSGSNSLGLLTGSSVGNLIINDTNVTGLSFDTLTLDGNLSVTANSISETGEAEDFGIQMTGTGKTAAFTVSEGGAVELNHAGGNDFGGNAVSAVGVDDAAAGAVTIADTNTTSLVLGNISSASLNVASAADISQSGSTTISVSGISAFDAGTHSISLGNENEFSDTVTVGHSGITAGAVTIKTGTDGIDLAMVDDNSNTKLSSLSLDSNGSIAQSNALVVTGTTALTAEGAIDLTNEDNDFNELTVSHAESFNLAEANEIDLAEAVIDGSYAADAGGNIRITGKLEASDIDLHSDAIIYDSGDGHVETGALTLDAGNEISFVSGANSFTSLFASVSAGKIELKTQSDVTLFDISTPGDFSLISYGSISQDSTSNIEVGDETTLQADDNIDLSRSNNDFQGVVNATVGNDIEIKDVNNLDLGDVTAAGDAVIQAADTLTLSGVTSAATVILSADQLNNTNGSDAVAASGWNIYLTNLAGNTFGGLDSENQAVWGTAYGDEMSLSGNRYVFGTNETLTLTPMLAPFAVSAVSGSAITYPAPDAGDNYQVSGFVNAGLYGNVFTQDTVNNIAISGLSFTSIGAAVGSYPITMTGAGVTGTGYSVSYDNTAVFGNLTILAPPVTMASTGNALLDLVGAEADESIQNDFQSTPSFDFSVPNLSGENFLGTDLIDTGSLDEMDPLPETGTIKVKNPA